MTDQLTELDSIINNIINEQLNNSYLNRIEYLKSQGMNTEDIEYGIQEATSTIEEGKDKSFVIYGEPQSGKTEVMIALTFKLVDLGFKTIFIVMNDNTELENQNYTRFLQTDLNPSPLKADQLKELAVSQLKQEKVRIIFCRKNANNLKSLIKNCRYMKNRIVIDDEADFASPNSKINKKDTTSINENLKKLGKFDETEDQRNGFYVGVTATPGRLDLNNTFGNNARKWIYLSPHDAYKGRSFFFPLTDEDKAKSDFQLKLLPEKGDSPKYLEDSIIRFLLRVAYLNLDKNNGDYECYSMLVHTAGRVDDHKKDKKTLEKVLEHFCDPAGIGKAFSARLFKEAKRIYPETVVYTKVLGFIIGNIGKSQVVVINSKNDRGNVDKACNPDVLFTFATGGNIVSRGLTFKNLLTFFFSRNVKGKLQQNTYIQRARMFGVRPYSKYFELTIPQSLYENWADCFQDHELSIQLGKAGHLAWVERGTNRASDSASIDRGSIVIARGEREVGDIFEMTNEIESILLNSNKSPLEIIAHLLEKRLIEDKHFPKPIRNFIEKTSKNLSEDCVMVFREENKLNLIQNIERYNDGDPILIRRKRGGIIQALIHKREMYENKVHYILPLRSNENKARFIYRQTLGQTISRNVRND